LTLDDETPLINDRAYSLVDEGLMIPVLMRVL
jgi:hypothetical protein